MSIVYLDNSATTPVLMPVVETMAQVMTHNFGNPSSMHSMGMRAEKEISAARQVLASACGVKGKEIYFTSGGTEANNLAIKGGARRRRKHGCHLITVSTEHPSVLNAFRALSEEGFEVSLLPVDSKGVVSLDLLSEALRRDTVLVSVMHVNSEVGVIQPLAEIGRLIKRYNPGIIFHVDAVQSLGRLPVAPVAWQADLLSLSAHKVHGPKGVGAIYCREGVLLDPLMHGGDQEGRIRPGTENTAGIAGFGTAVRLATENINRHHGDLQSLRSRFLDGLTSRLPSIKCNSPLKGAPHILNVTIPGIRGEVLVHALAEEGVYISTGSACHSRRPDPSHVLMAMGRSEEEIESSLRFSFSPYNTVNEIDYALEKVVAAVTELAVVTRRKR